MEEVDLTKDLELLEYHQADELLEQLILIQLHFQRIYEGKLISLCMNCLDKKHFIAVRGLTRECIAAGCRPKPLWEEMNSWANDILKNKINSEWLGKKNPKTKQLYEEARNYRKKVEEILDNLKRKYNYKGIHLSN